MLESNADGDILFLEILNNLETAKWQNTNACRKYLRVPGIQQAAHTQCIGYIYREGLGGRLGDTRDHSVINVLRASSSGYLSSSGDDKLQDLRGLISKGVASNLQLCHIVGYRGSQGREMFEVVLFFSFSFFFLIRSRTEQNNDLVSRIVIIIV